MCYLVRRPTPRIHLNLYLSQMRRLLAVRRRAFSKPAAAVFMALLFAETSAAQGTVAQSTYRFSKAPEFMLLSLYAGENLLGYTASLWDNSITSIVVGRVAGINRMELAFYPSSIDEPARREAFQAPVCRSSSAGFTAACFLHFAKTLQRLAGPVVASQTYLAGANRQNEWRAAQGNAANPYASFAFYKNHSISGLEERLRGGGEEKRRVMAGRALSMATDFSLTAVDELFGDRIVRLTGGVIGSQIAFQQRSCDEAATNLEGVLKKSGKWDITVGPEKKNRSFRVVIKSHSDRQYFYLPGVWWKAFVEISFDEDVKGRCSRADIHLYNSAVCAAPVSDDPDRKRRQCFQRILLDSRAEIDLSDELIGILVREYGKPL